MQLSELKTDVQTSARLPLCSAFIPTALFHWQITVFLCPFCSPVCSFSLVVDISQILSSHCHYSPFLFAFVQIREWRNEARQEGKNTDEREVKMMNNLARFCLHSWATSKWNATSRARAHPCCRLHHMTSHHHHGRKNWNELMDNEKSSITRLQQLG